VQLEIAHTL